ncbi:MAG TPA: ABC-2 family transporter protein [Gaiellaceae bacterium]|nr:ABC-2 family transporter protein [Gaiellaceae bacterium]
MSVDPAALPAPPAPAEAGRVRSMVDLYLTTMRMAVQEQLQYRTANYFYMLGMIAEPVIYLVVWTTIAEQQGGSVQGLSAGYFAAYYIVWTLVRNMNIVFGAPFWESRIREGQLSRDLLRPVLPLHYDIAYFAGWKVVVIVLWLPLAAGLSLVFDPVLDPRPLEIAVFAVAIWGAYLIRTMFQEALGMLCFFTTRGAAVFDLYMTTELLLSGRLVPMPLMPDWAEAIARFLPFQWAFFFPIESLVGDLSDAQLLGGLAAQLLWILVGFVLFRLSWRVAIRHYSAVGG